jgi:uncharacterized protein YndB with AHSA1/START domain
MGLFEPLLLKDSIEIKTTPEKIWDFFANLDKNYTTWHPDDHIVFKWVEGNPLQEGSKFYAEQLVMGKAKQYNGTISEIIPYRKIVVNFAFPISLVSPKIEWLLEPKNSTTVFSAITYMRFGKLFSKLFKKHMDTMIKIHNKHTWAEAENLKKIMEK